MTTFIGVDVSKLKLDIGFLPPNAKASHKTIPNNPQGFESLLQLLQETNITDAHICLESTGVYGQTFTTFMHQHGWKVSVVNPARIKASNSRRGYAGDESKKSRFPHEREFMIHHG